MYAVRPPAVAGSFYPADKITLARTVHTLLDEADGATPGETSPVKALIAPHAGYIYSGSTAALAYHRLAMRRARIRRVVLLGPTHRVAISGLALPDADAFATPLGEVAVDPAAAGDLAGLPDVVVNREAHQWEHSLEVHLPFLQTVLDEFVVVPLAVGRAEPERVAAVLDALWGAEETVVVVSSDLSHFLSYREATHADRRTLTLIERQEPVLTHAQACGATPVNGLLVATSRRGMRPEVLRACNSGDTAGDRTRVVGYAAVVFDALPEGRSP